MRKNKASIALLAIISAAALSFTACGGGSGQTTAAPTTTAAETTAAETTAAEETTKAEETTTPEETTTAEESSSEEESSTEESSSEEESSTEESSEEETSAEESAAAEEEEDEDEDVEYDLPEHPEDDEPEETFYEDKTGEYIGPGNRPALVGQEVEEPDPNSDEGPSGKAKKVRKNKAGNLAKPEGFEGGNYAPPDSATIAP